MKCCLLLTNIHVIKLSYISLIIIESNEIMALKKRENPVKMTHKHNCQIRCICTEINLLEELKIKMKDTTNEHKKNIRHLAA